jgi:predicted DNA-binding transcriptional regulator YafY
MLRTLVALSQRWHTTAELAEVVEAPVWTVRRDLKMFELAGIPLECNQEVGHGVGGRYRLSADWTKKFFKHVSP